MVHQHFSLVEELRVWENVALGDSGRLDRAAARRQVLDIGRRYGIDVDPDAVVGGLSAGLRQRVEIIKCLRRDPRILVFDEPTSVLTPAESEQLFGVLRRVVRDEQRAVALVSHKLEEILHATDQVTIMRRGAVVSTTTTAGATAASLAKAMVGRDVSLRAQSAALGLVSEADRVAHTEATGHEIGAPVLTVRGAMVSGRGGRRLLDGLDLQVHAGEVVGVAGVEGNGQRELADLLSSLLTLDAGTILIDGEPVSERAAGALLAAGVGVVPEDRHDSGCALALSVAENLFLSAPEQPAGRWLLRRSAMRRMADELIAEYRIDCSGPDAAMWSLSGGNQQRLVLARELSRRPKVLVAAQPTRGLDVGGIEYVTGKLRSAADTGVGVLLLSTEIEEILTLADRVLVIHRGRIVGEMARAEVDLEQLGILMGGAAP
jgi:simple sugar transport system ATP-binding protein